MYTFKVLPEYIPAGKVSDYKSKYGDDFGELIVACLTYQNVEAVTYVCSKTEKVYTEVKNIMVPSKNDIRYGTPSPMTLESILFEVIERTLPQGYFPLTLHKQYFSSLDIKSVEVDTIIDRIHSRLSNEITNSFPFHIRHKWDSNRGELEVFTYFHTTGINQVLFAKSVDEFLDEAFIPFQDTTGYFAW